MPSAAEAQVEMLELVADLVVEPETVQEAVQHNLADLVMLAEVQLAEQMPQAVAAVQEVLDKLVELLLAVQEAAEFHLILLVI
jgi:hypothetical protein